MPAEPLVTKSNGGVMSAELGKSACAQMILSGTAAGVIGASFVSNLSGFGNTMSLDIGGTSADIAFIRDGMPQYGVGEMIGEFPIYIPTVAVTSIGAGGGSIAWVDDLGVLKVGPESAGSSPGPACYGRGGERPTITDAFAVLGYIGQFELDNSAISIDADKARAAVGSVARRIGRSTEETAQAIVDIAVSGMYVEVSKLISRDGIDHREFAMQAFGGAGPMLACFLARELGMTHVVIPPTPGVLSALGGLIADVKSDFIATVFLDLDDDAMALVRDTCAELESRAVRWLCEEHGYDGEYRLVYSADMRYRGQSYEIETELDPSDVAQGNAAGIAEAFHRRHEQVYEHADREAPVQVINLRMVIVGASPKPDFPESRTGGRHTGAGAAPRRVHGRGDAARAAVRARGPRPRPPLRGPRGRRPERLHHLRPGGTRRQGGRLRKPDTDSRGDFRVRRPLTAADSGIRGKHPQGTSAGANPWPSIASPCRSSPTTAPRRPRAWRTRCSAPRTRPSSRRPRTSPPVSPASTARPSRRPTIWAPPGSSASTTGAPSTSSTATRKAISA